MPFNENTLEQVLIEDFQNLGYDYIYGPDLERDYHEVILKETFEESMFHINPGITFDIVEEAYQTIKNLGLVKMEEQNQTFHKYLVEGVSIPYRDGTENKTYQVKLMDFTKPYKNDFKVINQYTVIEHKNKRPDLVVFVNGEAPSNDQPNYMDVLVQKVYF